MDKTPLIAAGFALAVLVSSPGFAAESAGQWSMDRGGNAPNVKVTVAPLPGGPSESGDVFYDYSASVLTLPGYQPPQSSVVIYLAPGGGGGYYGAGPFLASGLGFGGYGGYGGFGTSGYGPFYGGFGLVPRAALFAGSGGRRY